MEENGLGMVAEGRGENLKNIYLGKNIEQYLTYFKKELSGEVGTKLKIKVCEAPFK